ncbi:HlyD family secretion protein [Pseudaminobacter salicylatoxidans]|uniref:HlyD family secretion protein n=1 Tax=Pseudaminobacter salicylatoxidans TaxID=93369 RepID=A0A316BT56_PSESE|nr:secretion protein HlyD [Pseudaminobacter salicylatoxidans]PWJ76365.1 HlyD family secretion protein [Pseudaminobacter salicylatoxidans]
MFRRIVILAVIIAGVAAAGYYTRGFGFLDKPDEGMVLYGNVDIRQVNLGFRVAGRIAEMPVDEGASVETGATLAQLDLQPFIDALRGAEAQVSAARAELEKRRAGNRPEEIAQAEATVAVRSADMVRARGAYERNKSLVTNNAVSQSAFEAAEAEYHAAEAQLRVAEEALALLRAGSRVEDIAAAEAQLATATAERDRVKTNLADATLLSPDAGTILTRTAEPGAIVQSGATIFTLTINRPIRVRAYVAEPDLGRIAPGMTVFVTTDGNPKVYHGVVGFISPTAEFTPRTVQTEELRADLVYRLRINVTDPDDRLRQGQPVTVRLQQSPDPGAGQ